MATLGNPDFLGLSMREALGESAVAKNFFESAGQRLCLKQAPAPGDAGRRPAVVVNLQG